MVKVQIGRTTMNLDHILNWKLQAGSHDFPGPHGGTCINEAAIVVAGFKYKKINEADDCPPCFSRPIAAYAIRLNDQMPDDLRNELLMPFVTRLAGTADTPEVEKLRAEFMVIQTVKRILPIAMRAVKLENIAVECEGVMSFAEARAVAKNAAAAAAYAAADAAYAAADAAYANAADAAYAAASRPIFTIATEILSSAIELGNQGDAIAVDLAVARMNKIREHA